MDAAKKARLHAAGWRTGDAADFLQLTPEETTLVEIRLALSGYVRQVRHERQWTQSKLAQRIGSSQSRVAKIEAADASVSLDLLINALVSMGASAQEVGRVIGRTA
ncbi:MAG: XRE family transcriptional regulator [Coriobacteriia bacterium]|nr:XRE family transcriptional regulator [Coriobacteriia bacterium]